MNVILFLLLEAKVEGNKTMSCEFISLLSQYTIHNQLPVIKPSAFANICNMIGYFCEIDLNFLIAA